MNKTVEFSNMLNEDIISKALSIHDMSTKRTTLEEDNQTKLAKLSTLKKELLFSKQNQDALSDRNLVLRKKFNIIDENSREEAAQISTETKAFFKKIGLKARIETITPQDYQGSLIQLKLQFVGNSDYHATFYYDPITEHYDCKFHLIIFHHKTFAHHFPFSNFNSS